MNVTVKTLLKFAALCNADAETVRDTYANCLQRPWPRVTHQVRSHLSQTVGWEQGDHEGNTKNLFSVSQTSCSFPLNALMDADCRLTMSSVRLYHLLRTLTEKKYFRMSLWHSGLQSFNEWPLVRSSCSSWKKRSSGSELKNFDQISSVSTFIQSPQVQIFQSTVIIQIPQIFE